MRLRSAPIALFLALLLSGCDLFGEEDTTIRASGTVVLAETGEPLEGISVVLNESGGLYDHTKVLTVESNSEGRFTLRYDAVDSFGYDIRINADPYNPDYTSGLFAVTPGEPRDLSIIELSRIED